MPSRPIRRANEGEIPDHLIMLISAAQNSVFHDEVAYFLTFKNDKISVIFCIHTAQSVSDMLSNYGDIAKYIVMIISKLCKVCVILQDYILLTSESGMLHTCTMTL